MNKKNNSEQLCSVEWPWAYAQGSDSSARARSSHDLQCDATARVSAATYVQYYVCQQTYKFCKLMVPVYWQVLSPLNYQPTLEMSYCTI